MVVLSFFMQWGSAFWATLRETAPFLVLGLVLAGTLHVLVPPRLIYWALGHGGWRGALRGALIGVPLPLCSCGVVPTALALRRQGASLASTIAFTIATPETSIDALAITAALLPAIFLGIRPLAALALAVLVGVAVELLSSTNKERLRQNVLSFSRAVERQAGSHDEQAHGLRANTGDHAHSVDEVCRVCGLRVPADQEGHAHHGLARLKAVFEYAFGAFFEDIATWLILGLAFAALIQTSGLGDFGVTLKQHPGAQVLLAILLGIPLYSCATATTPLAAVLLAKGLNPGAALALLLAGPATNVGNMFAFKRELGTRTTLIYYGALLALCWLMGMGLATAWPMIERYPALTMTGIGSNRFLPHMPDWVEVLSTWMLLVLCVQVWIKTWMHRGSCEAHEH